MIALVGTLAPVSCHPPAVRVPLPREVQLAPSVETSKVVRQTSGLAPPRSQVIVEPKTLRLLVTGSVLLRRPRLPQGWPQRLAKWPPTRIFPSDWIARASTSSSVEALKVVSRVPSGL